MSTLRDVITRTLGMPMLSLSVFIILTAMNTSSVNAAEMEVNEAENAIASISEVGQTEEELPSVKSGLLEENGKFYYYENGVPFTGGYKELPVNGVMKYYYFQEDGTAFTGGYKAFDKNGTRVYYYFQEDGTAFTSGYKNFEQGGKQYYFFFQEDGTAFTSGYKEIIIDGTLRYFYFLANGQGFNTGYKTVMIDGVKYYFYFESNGQAATDTMEAVPLGTRTAYFFMQNNGKAYTGGYKEVAGGGKTNYYYFLQNGQAFTTGYKTVVIDGVTYYYYFEENGKAFTGGLRAVPFGSASYYYFFQDTGKALTSTWNTVNGTKYYMLENGRAAKGWFCVGDGYYYANSNSAILTNTVVEGYALDSEGKSTTKYRIIQYVNQLTNPSMTNQQKIEVLYNWLLTNEMPYITNRDHVSASWVWKDSWVDDMAVSMMDNNGGNCFRYASFLGMMIHEATGLPVIVFHGNIKYGSGQTPHGWLAVCQDGVWYSYDVQLHKFRGYPAEQCYKVEYPGVNRVGYLDNTGTNLY